MGEAEPGQGGSRPQRFCDAQAGRIGLAKRIRASEFRTLPVIGLTSLSSEKDRRKGFAAGFDDYQVKLNRQDVLASIAEYIRS